jgi:hypothetical protein
MWVWSFGGEAGTFETIGTVSGAGTYGYVPGSFTVTSSTQGLPIGSVAGGQYLDGYAILSTSLPYSLVYDGSAVTDWLKTGANLADWWVSQVSGNFHFVSFELYDIPHVFTEMMLR